MKQTAIEWLIEQIINDHNKNALTRLEWIKVFEQAKEMEKQQIEISDEEIEKEMLSRSGMWEDSLCFEIGWKDAIKWYREQICC